MQTEMEEMLPPKLTKNHFFLNYLLRFPTARDFMFYVKLISIDFCVFFAKYKNVEQSKTPYLKLHIYAIFGSFLEPF